MSDEKTVDIINCDLEEFDKLELSFQKDRGIAFINVDSAGGSSLIALRGGKLKTLIEALTEIQKEISK